MLTDVLIDGDGAGAGAGAGGGLGGAPQKLKLTVCRHFLQPPLALPSWSRSIVGSVFGAWVFLVEPAAKCSHGSRSTRAAGVPLAAVTRSADQAREPRGSTAASASTDRRGACGYVAAGATRRVDRISTCGGARR
jgi:hypothetical protein